MAQLLAAPYSQFFDANGVPLNGGLIYTYAAGTTTPKDSYTDSAGVTPAANPVVLDSGGRAAIWLSGSYKITVKDSLGNILETVDNITPAGSSSGSTFLDNAFLIENSSDATKKVAFDASGLTTATTRTFAWPDKNGTVAMTSDITGKITLSQVTDTTDISLSAITTQANVGATKSLSIPTKGTIQLEFYGEVIGTVQDQEMILGIRIGSTNYWPQITAGGTVYYQIAVHDASGLTTVAGSSGNDNVVNSAANQTTATHNGKCTMSIEQNAIPTGTQTVQVVAARASGTGAMTLKGTVVTSRIHITIFDFS